MKRKTIISLFGLLLFATTSVSAGWAPNGIYTENKSDRPQITNGVWTLTLISKANIEFFAHTEGGTTVLDLRDVNTDLAAAGSNLQVTGINGGGFRKKTDSSSGFSTVTGLTEVYLPEECTYFGKEVFMEAKALEKVVLSSQMGDFVNSHAFSICNSLKTVSYNGAEVEEGVVRFPSSVTYLANNTFEMSGNNGITKIIAPGVKKIGSNAIRQLYKLESVEFSPDFEGFDSNSGQNAFYQSGKDAPNGLTISPAKWKGPAALNANGQTFRDSGLVTHLDWSLGTFTAVPELMFLSATKCTGVTLPISVNTLQKESLNKMAAGATIRFCGDMPGTVNGSGTYAPLYTTSDSNRYKIVVDAAKYTDWVDPDKGFSEYTGTGTESDYPTGETVLGWTTFASGGRKHWLIQYVDRTPYTVTWYDDDGTTVLGTTTVINNNYATWPNEVPTKTSTAQYDYTFDSWTPATNAAPVTAATSFQAVWTASTRSYEIAWKMDDGTTIDTATVQYGDVPTHADASKASAGGYSYEFIGWSIDGETVLATIPPVDGPATYIAVFERHDATTTATVSWFDEDGTTELSPAQTTVSKGVQPVHEAPTKAPTIGTTYTFDGWIEIGGDGSVIAPSDLPEATGDVSYKAHYVSSTRQYTVTFADWDGSVITAVAYDYQTAAESVAVPANPSRPADAEYTYAFASWSPAIVADVTGDATYTAQYSATANEYTATFVNGIDESEISHATFAFGAAVTTPEPPEVVGHHFTAWSPAVSTMPAANTTYTALYEADIYTITWLNANGALLGTTKVAYNTMPEHEKVSLGATAKESYAFAGWSPALAPAEGNATYTAVYTRTILKSMSLALKSASYDRETGVITVLATIVNPGFGGETTGEIVTAPATDGNAVTIEDGTNVTATIVKPLNRKGYEWTLSVTQLASGVSETATIKGRSWARNQRDWFAESDVSWVDGEYEPGISSPAQQQIRVRGRLKVDGLLPNVLPNASGARLGVAVCQPNAGVAPCYYAWNGSEWVKLVGVLAKSGVEINLLGVVDFARKNGPAVAWYADGFQLTTEEGDWEVPLAGGVNLESFKRVGDMTLDSLAGDYDVGGQGFSILVR